MQVAITTMVTKLLGNAYPILTIQCDPCNETLNIFPQICSINFTYSN